MKRESIAALTPAVDLNNAASTHSQGAGAALSIVRAIQPRVLTKSFARGSDGSVTRTPGGHLLHGVAVRTSVCTPSELAALICTREPSDALMYGVADAKLVHLAAQDLLEARRAVADGDVVVGRNKAHFRWPAGPGILMLDYDPPEDVEPLDADGLVELLAQAVPELRDAPAVVVSSASSYIFDTQTGEQVIGARGLRMLVLVADARDVPRAGRVLFDRLVLAGHGRIDVSGAGSMLERGPIDAAVWSEERLDFVTGAHCVPPLEQRRPDPIVRNDEAAFLDTSKAMRELTAGETGSLRDTWLRLKGKPDIADLARERRDMWIDGRAEDAHRRQPGVDRAEHRRRIAESLDRGVLDGALVLQFQDGEQVTVAEVVADPEKFAGRHLADPLEPGYRNDPRIAIVLYDGNGPPVIFSHAHGPRRFELDAGAATHAVADPRAAEHLSRMGDLYSEAVIADSMIEHSVGNLLYAADRSCYMLFDGKRWYPDLTGAGFDLARLECREYARAARGDPALHKSATSTATRLESAKTVSGVDRLARNDQRIAVTLDTFDRRMWLLNTPEGTVDLRTGALRPHDRADRLTMMTSVAPALGAPCPTFDSFMRDVTLGDPALVDYLQVVLGYSLTGDCSLHALFYWYGLGRNGKSTLADLLLRLMPGYAKKIPASTLMTDSKGTRHPTEIASLKGVRLAIGSEVQEGAYWDESKIKELTGDAVLTARFMRQDFFEFERTNKILVLGNYRPRLRSIDPALRARLKMIPFLADFTGREDRQMAARLDAEGPAILGWLIEGARLWATERKLPACQAVDDLTADYFEAQSTVEMWISERCVVEDSARSRSGDLYTNYREWKLLRGEQPVSQTLFGEQMGARFAKSKSQGYMTIVGLRLVPPKYDDPSRGASAVPT